MKKRSNVMTRLVIVVGFLLLSFGVSNAQYTPVFRTPYKTALGIRVGGTSGADIKHFFRPATAVEGILGVFGDGFSITGLVEKNAQAFDVEGLNWYYGGGAHIAFYNGNRNYGYFGRDIHYRDSNDVGIGINGIIGLEYILPDNIPVAFSLDLKPFIEIDSDGDVGVAPDLALGIKFLIR
jgi:hypothetical protein